jgi:hypothetical protein
MCDCYVLKIKIAIFIFGQMHLKLLVWPSRTALGLHERRYGLGAMACALLSCAIFRPPKPRVSVIFLVLDINFKI